MKPCRTCGIAKPLGDYYTHGAMADGHLNHCKECVRARVAAAKAANPDAVKLRSKVYYQKTIEQQRLSRKSAYATNPDPAKERSRLWYAENKERVSQRSREYAERNKDAIAKRREAYRERTREQKRLADVKYRAENKAKCNAIDAYKRARKRQATPKWISSSDKLKIEIEYQLAAWCSQVMGTKYHVDHIIPLSGKTVCGLHVPWNLQVIPANDNLRKSNKLVAA